MTSIAPGATRRRSIATRASELIFFRRIGAGPCIARFRHESFSPGLASPAASSFALTNLPRLFVTNQARRVWSEPMKFLSSQFAYLLRERSFRQNLKALAQYVVFLTATIGVFSVLFHLIMVYEGQEHSWITGVYWTLTVMSTLGFGDITFQSDLGRGFSILVLISGIVLLLVVLPFAFIRFFYAPWLEAQLRLRAPRKTDEGTADHVIICRYDALARGLIERLNALAIPYVVIEPDPKRAAHFHGEGIEVVTGELDSKATYEAVSADKARLVVANLDDAHNTNITLTVREVAASVPITAIISSPVSQDILELSGASNVIIAKQELGQHLATRVDAGATHVHEVGHYRSLFLAEFPVHGTELSGKTIKQTKLREDLGLTIVAYWDRGELHPAAGESVLSDYSVLVVAGAPERIKQLDVQYSSGHANNAPVVVLGGGGVGCATASALKKAGIRVRQVEKNDALADRIRGIADDLIIGDAADLQVLLKAGIKEAPSVVLTTNSDATNIYLAVYCRRLNPDLRIVSRITHDRNLEAIHRAGADFVLSDTSLAVKKLVAMIQDRDLFVLGEEVDLFFLTVPASVAHKTLAQSEIGKKTGLNVIAIQQGEVFQTSPGPHTRLPETGELVVIGTPQQREQFHVVFQVTEGSEKRASSPASLPAPLSTPPESSEAD